MILLPCAHIPHWHHIPNLEHCEYRPPPSSILHPFKPKMPVSDFTTLEKYQYLNGFGSFHEYVVLFYTYT